MTPARRGDTLVFSAAVNRTWRTSMEIGCRVEAESLGAKERRHILSAYLTFIALDANDKPQRVPEVRPQSPAEQQRYKEAEFRRSYRLREAEDLKRLLSGSGVLDFRIAVTTENPRGVNPVEMREQLASRGARNTDSPVARWYEINDFEQWVDTPEQMASMTTNPAAYFRGRDLVAEGPAGPRVPAHERQGPDLVHQASATVARDAHDRVDDVQSHPGHSVPAPARSRISALPHAAAAAPRGAARARGGQQRTP